MKDYEIVVGLEIHVQLDTQTKMFCDCLVVKDKNALPNTSVCQTCMGFPGTLPVVNRGAVERAVLLAKALGCDNPEIGKINAESFWDRKHYFYPDLTKGYQITQYEKPFAEGGILEYFLIHGNGDGNGISFFDYKINFERIHLEEDTGKSFHADGNTYIDFNRAGTPLIEIVTKPEIRGSVERVGMSAVRFLTNLQWVLMYAKFDGLDIKISEAKPESGNMRFDVNISVRKYGEEKFGTKQEIKNLNSFQSVKDAIDYQAREQIEILKKDNGKIEQATFTFDEKDRVTKKLRSKEQAHDYRYFREPDLPNLVIDEELQLRGFRNMFELRTNFMNLGFSIAHSMNVLMYPSLVLHDYSKGILDYLRSNSDLDVLSITSIIENSWYYGDLQSQAFNNPKYLENLELNKLLFIEMFGYLLLKTFITKEITPESYKKLVDVSINTKTHPKEFISEYFKNSDSSELDSWVDEAISESPSQWKEFKAGKEALLAFFIGQVMKKSKGKADAKIVTDILKTK